jgi:hypothetical protein
MHKANGADCQKNGSVCATRLALEVQGLRAAREISKRRSSRQRETLSAAVAGVWRETLAGERERGTGSPRGALKASLITRAVYLGAKCLLFVITINIHTRSLLLGGWAWRKRERERDWERDKNLNGLELNAP